MSKFLAPSCLVVAPVDLRPHYTVSQGTPTDGRYCEGSRRDKVVFTDI